MLRICKHSRHMCLRNEHGKAKIICNCWPNWEYFFINSSFQSHVLNVLGFFRNNAAHIPTHIWKWPWEVPCSHMLHRACINIPWCGHNCLSTSNYLQWAPWSGTGLSTKLNQSSKSKWWNEKNKYKQIQNNANQDRTQWRTNKKLRTFLLQKISSRIAKDGRDCTHCLCLCQCGYMGNTADWKWHNWSMCWLFLGRGQ